MRRRILPGRSARSTAEGGLPDGDAGLDKDAEIEVPKLWQNAFAKARMLHQYAG
jgi:hypothetical protein